MWSWPEIFAPPPPSIPEPWTPGDLPRARTRSADLGAGDPGPDAAALAALHAEALERTRAEGFEEGMRAGRREMEEALAARVDRAVALMEAAADACREALDGWMATLEGNLVALSLAAARHIIDREVQQDPAIVAALIRRGMAAFPQDQRLRIRLSPEDLSALSAEGVGGRPLLPGGRDMEWIPDPLIGSGGCMVEGPESVLDGRVDTALERLYWRLAE